MKTFARIFCISVLFLTVRHLQASEQSIIIEHSKHRLIAPAGSDYSWFHNGELLTGVYNRQIGALGPGEYRVAFTDKDGKKVEETITVAMQQGALHKIFVIGDSTVATYNDSKYPQKGWGQVLQLYFNNAEIEVVNKAIGGRSSRSFHEEGRWTEVMNSLAAGDFVFIQFGHNDRDWTKPERYTDTATYKNYLRIYVNDSRSKGAIPVLVSPMIMHAYNGTVLRNVFTEGANDYRGSMLKVAQELDVPFVDLNMKSFNRVKEVGKEYAAYYLYLGLLAGEYPNFPTGSSDGTHFQEMGALEMAGLITEGLKELAADTSIAKLNQSLAQLYNVEVSMNIPGAGVVTSSGSYPAGAAVTLKTRLKDSFNFAGWKDDLGQPVSANGLYTFTMGSRDYSFVANIKDCNGTEGGSATIDKCGYCSGGNTGRAVCEKQFQCESSCGFDGIIESDSTTDIKRTFVNMANQPQGGVTYVFTASYDSVYKMAFVYKSSGGEEMIKLLVNHENINTFPVEVTNTWDTLFFDLALSKGSNIFRLETSLDEGGALFDNLFTATGGLISGNCSILGLQNTRLPQVSFYPNPFQENLILEGEAGFDYRIISVTGIALEHGTCMKDCEAGKNLEKGMYILQIKNDRGNDSWIVQKN
ncbi:MAG: hypothetical protein JXB00_19500 [Bacteroidales bacterium]|nr:hypothetical protein [Bacteroidales bacterium]